MENKFNRFLSLVLAFVMVLGMMPAAVFATEADEWDGSVTINIVDEDGNGVYGTSSGGLAYLNLFKDEDVSETRYNLVIHQMKFKLKEHYGHMGSKFILRPYDAVYFPEGYEPFEPVYFICDPVTGTVSLTDENFEVIEGQTGLKEITIVVPKKVIDTAEELQAALNAGGNVVLGGDITGDGNTLILTVRASTKATLDLNGYTLTMTGMYCPALLTNNGELTIEDNSAEGDGGMRCPAIATCIQNNGTMVINGGNFHSTNRGTLECAAAEEASVVVNGGTFDSIGRTTIGKDIPDGNITITGGTFRAPVRVRSITGGTFAEDVSSMVAEGYECTKIGSNTWTVQEKACEHAEHGIDGKCLVCNAPVDHDFSNGNCVCGADDGIINTEDELQAALNAGGNVVLGGDITLGQKLTITSDSTITGAYTITRADDYTGTLFAVNAGAELTLDGGLVIDGGNNWTLNETLYNENLKNGVKGTKRADVIASEENAPKATAAMFVVGGTVNANRVTIQNSYSDKDSNSGDSTIFQMSGTAALTMTGATIKHIATGGANAVAYMKQDTTWTINDGTLIDDTFSGRNGGVCRIDGKGSIVMNGGTISHSRGINTNGTVFMFCNTSTFEMNGGTICSNSSLCGSNNGRLGAVYLHDSSAMTMNGGNICHNTGYWVSGGIDIATANAKLTITGGNVFYNETISDEYNYDDVAPGDHTTISGGWYSQDISEWVAEGYGVIVHEGAGENGETLYQVAPVITVTFDDKTMTEGEAVPELTYTIDYGIADENAVTVTVEADAIEAPAAGEYAITGKATLSDPYKYAVKVVPGKLTVEDTGILTVDGVWFDSFDEAKSAIVKNSEIVLYADVVNNFNTGYKDDYKFPNNGGTITMELNGHQFHSSNANGRTTITIGANTTLVVTDSVGTGSFLFDNKGHPLCLSNNAKLYLPETIDFVGTIQLYYPNGQVYLGETCMLGQGGLVQANTWTDAKGNVKQYNNVYIDAKGDLTLGGGSFTLTEDFSWAAERSITIPAGVTVDLNGNDLTAKNIQVKGNLIDTADGVGAVKAETLVFTGHDNGGYLPLYDVANKCYRLFDTDVKIRGAKLVGSTTVKFGCTVYFNKAEAYTLLAEQAGSNDVLLDVAWSGSWSGGYEYAFTNVKTFAVSAAKQIAAKGSVGLAMTHNGENLQDHAAGDVITVTPAVASDLGVTITGEVFEYNVK